MADQIKSGRAWAWSGFALGIGASIAANITHSYLVQVAKGATNFIGPVTSAAFWPLALFLCLEVMSRVLWPQGWIWWLVRYIGLTLVAGIAAIVSWRHMNGLLDTYGEDQFVAVIGPVAVDGLMVVCSSALLAIGYNIKQRAMIHDVVERELRPAEVPLPSPLPVLRDVPKNPPAVPVPKIVPAKVKLPNPLPPASFRTADELLEAARQADAEHRSRTGKRITRDALRDQLHISARKASDALHKLREGADVGEQAIQPADVA